MRTIQVIELRGRPVALALADEAILADHITDDEQPIVAGMALYALEVQAGARPGPYTDADAERYARRELALRAAARPVPRPRRGGHRRATARP
ncbi:MAG: hypothetical protein WKF94_16375 [Solirubrobacteraceae bacterium]